MAAELEATTAAAEALISMSTAEPGSDVDDVVFSDLWWLWTTTGITWVVLSSSLKSIREIGAGSILILKMLYVDVHLQ